MPNSATNYSGFDQCSSHRIYENQADKVQYQSLERDMLSTSKSYVLDCGNELFVWMGRDTSLQDRKAAVLVAQVNDSTSTVSRKVLSIFIAFAKTFV